MTDRTRRVLRVALLLGCEVGVCAVLCWISFRVQYHFWAEGVAAKARQKQQEARQKQEERFADSYGGREALDTIRNPDSVDVWLVGRLSRGNPPGHERITDPPGNIEEAPSRIITLNAEQMARLIALVDGPDAYVWNLHNLCGFHLDACALFKRGESRVQLEFCFGCSDARSYLNGERAGGQRPMTPETDRAVREFIQDIYAGQSLSRRQLESGERVGASAAENTGTQ